MWYEPDSNTSYVYDGASWIEMTVTAHSQLSGITDSDHHNPVTTADPLTVDAGQGLGLSLASMLTVDADGNLSIPDNSLAESLLSFDTATQSELDSVSTDLSDHAGSTGGIHGVASGDTVAGQSDVDTVSSNLSDHESDTTNPHNVTDDQTGAATALSNHASDNSAHHSRPTSTQSESISGGYTNPQTHTGSIVDNTKWVTVGTLSNGNFVDGLRISNDGSQYVDVTRSRITDTGGSTTTINHSNVAGGNTLEIPFSSQPVEKVESEISTSYNSDRDVDLTYEPHVVTLPSHNHGV
ncbi:hypothetical protein DU484_06130 [Haloplanus rubicundus]|uniref:Uncharacterized protein n=2 Tax=Haloplanus rubicundus TaxID=1547898 RepID=A0A345EBA6_9EURY|nr:hypothetical protein DU484_06130 [Haloplanus rubicundus]